jgi:ATP-dependent DNA helicase RecG
LLRFADLATDEDLLIWARQIAPMLLAKYPEMAERHIARWLGGKSEFLKA